MDTTTNMVKNNDLVYIQLRVKWVKTKNTNRDSREVKYQNETKQKKHKLTSFTQWSKEKLTRSGAIKPPIRL